MSVVVIGSVNLDTSRRVAALPRWGETVMAASSARHAGGKGLNQAIAAARAGSEVGLIAAVGDDEPGRWLTGELAAAGVDVTQVARAAEPTGDAQILVADDGENMIVVTPGANAVLSAPAEAAGDVFLAQLEVPLAAVEALFRTPAARAGTRMLNAAPATPEAIHLLPLCDLLLVNETELAVLAGLADPPRDIEAATAAARSLGVPGLSVVVTLGKAGAIAVTGETTVPIPGRPAHAVDTTGAGDCFCGALAAGLDQGLALDRALRFANVAASLSVERPGAAASMPSREEILAAL